MSGVVEVLADNQLLIKIAVDSHQGRIEQQDVHMGTFELTKGIDKVLRDIASLISVRGLEKEEDLRPPDALVAPAPSPREIQDWIESGYGWDRVAAARRLVGLRGHDTVGLVILGLAYAQNDDLDLGLASLEAARSRLAPEADPAAGFVLNALGAAYLRAGLRSQAWNALKEAETRLQEQGVTSYGGTQSVLDNLLLLADFHLSDLKPAAAKKYLDLHDSMVGDPLNASARALYLRGLYYTFVNEPQKAIDVLVDAKDRAPPASRLSESINDILAAAHINLAENTIDINNLDSLQRGSQSLIAAAKLNPTALNHFRAGNSLMYLEEMQKAIAQFGASLGENKRSNLEEVRLAYSALANTAEAYITLDDFELAESFAEKALDEVPTPNYERIVPAYLQTVAAILADRGPEVKKYTAFLSNVLRDKDQQPGGYDASLLLGYVHARGSADQARLVQSLTVATFGSKSVYELDSSGQTGYGTEGFL